MPRIALFASSSRLVSLSLLLMISVKLVAAAPIIDIPKTTFDCGTVVQGKTTKLHASFLVRNSGKVPLHITSVRPACGCTVATFDSLIAPGKTGEVTADVNISNFRTGPFTRTLALKSDAGDTAGIPLVIKGVIEPGR